MVIRNVFRLNIIKYKKVESLQMVLNIFILPIKFQFIAIPQ